MHDEVGATYVSTYLSAPYLPDVVFYLLGPHSVLPLLEEPLQPSPALVGRVRPYMTRISTSISISTGTVGAAG
jgi:hypothetical protein